MQCNLKQNDKQSYNLTFSRGMSSSSDTQDGAWAGMIQRQRNPWSLCRHIQARVEELHLQKEKKQTSNLSTKTPGKSKTDW
jgi:hypothetical protein